MDNPAACVLFATPTKTGIWGFRCSYAQSMSISEFGRRASFWKPCRHPSPVSWLAHKSMPSLDWYGLPARQGQRQRQAFGCRVRGSAAQDLERPTKPRWPGSTPATEVTGTLPILGRPTCGRFWHAQLRLHHPTSSHALHSFTWSHCAPPSTPAVRVGMLYSSTFPLPFLHP